MANDHEATPARPVEEVRAEARALIDKGIEALKAGNVPDALEAFDGAEKLAYPAGLADLHALANMNRGLTHWATGDLEAARTLFADAMKIAKEAEDDQCLGLSLVNLATVSRLLNRWPEACAAYEQYLPLIADDPESSAGVHIDCALSYAQTALFDAAATHLADAERIAEEADLGEVLISVRLNQGALFERRSEPEDAVASYVAAVERARERGLREWEAIASASLAPVLAKLGRAEEADTRFLAAEEIFRELGDRHALADTLLEHAAILRSAGDRERALAALREEEFLRLDLKEFGDLGDCLFEQSEILAESGDDEQVEHLLTRAKTSFEQAENFPGLAETLLRLSALYRRSGRAEESLKAVNEAFDATGDEEMPDIECRAWAQRAILYADQGQTDEAEDDLSALEAKAAEIQFLKQAIVARAIRAYVMARKGEPAEAVRAQLEAARDYSVEVEMPEVGTEAVGVAIADIEAHAGDKYGADLESFKAAL